jgi:2-aminoadipate transaminase
VYRPSQRANWAEGQPISELMARALANPDLISLAAGFVDQQTLPAEETGKALANLFDDADAAQAALQYGTTPGYPPLRELLLDRALAAEPESSKAPRTTLDQVVVTAGSNQLLHLVVESLLDPGDIVLCAAPTYLVFLGTLANVGARSVGVATDEQGLIPEALVETLRRLDAAGDLGRVKAIYLVPYFDNPCGVTMPVERVAQAVEIAKSWSTENRIHVIADEAYHELRYAGEDVPSAHTLDADGDTVVVAGTFSKSFSPGIRVGWGILPKDLVGPVCSQKGNFDFGSPNFSQHLMHRVMRDGLFDSHIEQIRAGYRLKLQAMLEALEEHLSSVDGVHWFAPRGGLYVWLHLPEEIDSGLHGRLFDLSMREGVLYVPGRYCFPLEGEPIHANTMRLSFGVQSCEKIREGIAALSRAIRAV